ncbi:hypothetical protein BDW02DRAFT_584816 [Decorospora gaudefroyi]|uniref:Uncharacterized protein n=1 Tax=Decorospora gaudefroyi TaxID=184978 RepID=A0A6A5KXP0_9PLEO|nr:hypothetical protein BDW02DRAFT_584816 [Decorospora gaudefroyi]
MDWVVGDPTQPAFTTLTYGDVSHARALLKALNLPTELVLSILDYAEYWPTYTFARHKPSVASARGNSASAATLCLDAPIYNNPITAVAVAAGERAKCKRIEFHVVSRDQGWTSENTQGTYSTSSWLEVSILRPCNNNTQNRGTPPDLMNLWMSCPRDYRPGRGWELVKRPQRVEQGPQGGEGDCAWFLQGNRVVTGNQDYRIVWSEFGRDEGDEGAGSGEGFVQALQDGDRVLVWARAKWHGWQCIVEKVDVIVSYGF